MKPSKTFVVNTRKAVEPYGWLMQVIN